MEKEERRRRANAYKKEFLKKFQLPKNSCNVSIYDKAGPILKFLAWPANPPEEIDEAVFVATTNSLYLLTFMPFEDRRDKSELLKRFKSLLYSFGIYERKFHDPLKYYFVYIIKTYMKKRKNNCINIKDLEKEIQNECNMKKLYDITVVELMDFLQYPYNRMKLFNLQTQENSKIYSVDGKKHKIRGVAGSGKTTALAYRACESALLGKKVLFTYFNKSARCNIIEKLLSLLYKREINMYESLEENVEKVFKNVEVIHFHRLISDLKRKFVYNNHYKLRASSELSELCEKSHYKFEVCLKNADDLLLTIAEDISKLVQKRETEISSNVKHAREIIEEIIDDVVNKKRTFIMNALLCEKESYLRHFKNVLLLLYKPDNLNGYIQKEMNDIFKNNHKSSIERYDEMLEIIKDTIDVNSYQWLKHNAIDDVAEILKINDENKICSSEKFMSIVKNYSWIDEKSFCWYIKYVASFKEDRSIVVLTYLMRQWYKNWLYTSLISKNPQDFIRDFLKFYEGYYKIFKKPPNYERILMHELELNGIDRDEEEIYSNTGKKNKHLYSAIYVDELQDFEEEWFKFIENTLKADESVDFVVAIDPSQNIYKRKRWWNKYFKGRYMELPDMKKSFRMPKEIASLANELVKDEDDAIRVVSKVSNEGAYVKWKNLATSEGIVDEVYSIIERLKSDGERFTVVLTADRASAYLIHHFLMNEFNTKLWMSWDELSEFEIKSALKKHYPTVVYKGRTISVPDEVVVGDFVAFKNDYDKLIDDENLPNSIHHDMETNLFCLKKYLGYEGILVSTIKYYKGYEADNVIVVITDTIKISNKDVYAAVTRARKNLFVLNYRKEYEYLEDFVNRIQERKKL